MHHQNILPELSIVDSEALASSAQLEVQLLEEWRELGGWMSFAHFMQRCLYAPQWGYYCGGATKLGVGGDFVTAPELTPLFAQVLAGVIQSALTESGGVIFELGAGTGRLAFDLLWHLDQNQLQPKEYWILEVSPQLKARQQATLDQLPRHLRDRVHWLETWPDSWSGVLVANEVLDALPVHRVVWRSGSWRELGVTHEDGKWRWSEGEISSVELQAALPKGVWDEGYQTEINVLAPALVRQACQSQQSGIALWIDYGYPQREYFHERRSRGTLRCHYQHQVHDDPFWYPGLQDITAHVNFTDLVAPAREQGWGVEHYKTLAQWLIDGDLLDLVSRMSRESEVEYYRHLGHVQKLLHPNGMGEVFKVLQLRHGVNDSGVLSALLD